MKKNTWLILTIIALLFTTWAVMAVVLTLSGGNPQNLDGNPDWPEIIVAALLVLATYLLFRKATKK